MFEDKEPSDNWVGRRLPNPDGASQGQSICPVCCQAKKEDIRKKERERKEGRKKRKERKGRKTC